MRSVTPTDAGLAAAGRDVLEIRPAGPADAAAVAATYLAARRAAAPRMPLPVHPEAEVRAWVAGKVAGDDEVWVACRAGEVVGYLALARDWLDDLYVAPAAAGQGVGSAMLATAQSLRPTGFALWVFEANEPARAFYRRRGLVELEHTDGSGNEERAPDLRMAWPGRDPLRYLRAEIDAADAELAALLSRRAALTATVQSFKPVPGRAGRDRRREREIVDRMAALAPDLDQDRLARTMHEVIEAGLERPPPAPGP